MADPILTVIPETIHQIVTSLMRDEGLTINEARERMLSVVDHTCDEVAYGGDEES